MKWLFTLKSRWIEARATGFFSWRHVKLSDLVQSPWFVAGALSLVAAPLIVAAVLALHVRDELNYLSGHVEQMPLKIERAFLRQSDQQAFIKKYGAAHPDYLEKFCKKVTFLEGEIEELMALKRLPALSFCPAIEERLAFLTGGENALNFTCIDRKEGGGIVETVWKQDRPIELDDRDFENLLVALEKQTAPEKPQMVVSALHFKRREVEGKERYVLEMEIIERRGHTL